MRRLLWLCWCRRRRRSCFLDRWLRTWLSLLLLLLLLLSLSWRHWPGTLFLSALRAWCLSQHSGTDWLLGRLSLVLEDGLVFKRDCDWSVLVSVDMTECWSATTTDGREHRACGDKRSGRESYLSATTASSWSSRLAFLFFVGSAARCVCCGACCGAFPCLDARLLVDVCGRTLLGTSCSRRMSECLCLSAASLQCAVEHARSAE